MASLVRRGSCLCKAITFSITGAPARMIQCNCLGCQKSSGSALLSNVLYKRDVRSQVSDASSLTTIAIQGRVRQGQDSRVY